MKHNRITACFAALHRERRSAFVVFLFAGDPDLDTSVDLVVGLDAAGVDIVELGIPYSDPMADGPANQAACERALAAGTTVRGVLATVGRIRQQSQVPILIYTYLNPIVAYGTEAFATDAVEAGVDGVLFLDLPPEDDPGIRRRFRQAGLATVMLVTPNTTVERRDLLARQSTGFLYYVCRLGVTGERGTLPEDLSQQVGALRQQAQGPVCVGFGISTPEQAAAVAGLADGVIVGSHLVRLIADGIGTIDLVDRVCARAGLFAQAVHGT